MTKKLKRKNFLNRWVEPSNIPGFKLTFGFTLIYLAFFVIIPFSGLFFKTASLTLPELIKAISTKRVMHAYMISFSTAYIAAIINMVFGLIVAWILVR
jgi:sulfate transport system permease protein